MEVNNYPEFAAYIETLKGYQDFPCILFYKQKKGDIPEEDFTAFKKIFIVQSYDKINMDAVKKTCRDNKCRCYVMVIDKFFLKFMSKVSLTTDVFLDFLENEMLDSSGLHLIDLDDPEIREDVLCDHLIKLGAKNLYVFRSRTGRSLVFYGKTEIIDIYNKQIGPENTNAGHNICAINLFIPDYYGSK